MTARSDNPPLPQQQTPSAMRVQQATNPPAAIRSFFLPGPSGRLEALLNEGSPNAPYAALVCHPHPLGGGTMHNKVVYHAAKVFSSFAWPVLRFNFRGTGISEGEHHGQNEVNDVRAALDWLAKEYDKPIVAAGFSFGSVMGLEASSTDPRVFGFAALGLPTEAEGRQYTYPFLPACIFPKLFLSGDRDQYASVESLRSIIEAAPPPTQFNLISNADHFFVGRLQAMQTALGAWLEHTFVNDPSAIPTPENLYP